MRTYPATLTCYDVLNSQHGSVYKLAFGPKSFVVVSDPIVARHILRENAFCYDKVCCLACTILVSDMDCWKLVKKRIVENYGIYKDLDHDHLTLMMVAKLIYRMIASLQLHFAYILLLVVKTWLRFWIIIGVVWWVSLLHVIWLFLTWNQGVLAEILKPIMGKGLIPADLDTWKQRRKG